MKNIIKIASIVLLFSLSMFGLTNKASAAKLTLYCSVEIDVCEMLEQAYEKETGTKVAMTRASSGETFAKIKGIKEIMYPGQNKFNRYKQNLKKEINIPDIIKKDLEILSN